MPEITAIVLAAGRSSRWRAAGGSGESKLLAEFGDAPVVRRVVEASLASSVHTTIVVLGHAATQVREALSGPSVHFVENPDFAEGMSTSLRVGLAAVPATAEAVVVLLGDMPRVRAETIDALIDALVASPQAAAVIPVVEGRRGNPVLLRRELFPALQRLEGDKGAKPVLDALERSRIVEIEMDWDCALDVDTPDALRTAKLF